MKKSPHCYTLLAFLAAVLTFSGCASRIPLTKALIKEYNLTFNDIKRLQLYISDDIILEQEATSVNKDIDQTHSLKKVEDQYIRRIFFNSETPCIALETAAERLKVSFEPVDNLTFIYEKSASGSEGYIFRPVKKVLKDNVPVQVRGNFYNNWRIIGEQKYGDSTYNVIIKENYPLILVDQASLRTFLLESRTVPGMRQTDVNK
jgi:hypothetical protein